MGKPACKLPKQRCCMITVWHHIVPSYMGGSDDPENMIELTYKEHATAHFLLWLEHHNEEDWLAWLGFEKLIDKEEFHRRVSILGGQRAVELKKGVHTEDKELKSKWGKIGAKANYEKNKDKIIATLRENAKRGAELGLGGYEKDKWIWITNGEESKKALKAEQLSDGWRRGRHSRSTQKVVT